MSEALETQDDETVHRLAAPQDPLLLQWAKFRPLFAEAMEGGDWTVEDLEQKIAHRRAYFFPGKDAAVVAEILAYPNGSKVMQATWACGDVTEILTMVPGIEAIARMMGCNKALVEGRPGWTKALASLGYAQWSVTLAKDL